MDDTDLAHHPLLPDPPTAYGLALVLAETFRPGRYVVEDRGYQVLDGAAVAQDMPVVSTGERVLLGVIRSLAGEAPVDLSRLDALDPARARLISNAIGLLARRGG